MSRRDVHGLITSELRRQLEAKGYSVVDAAEADLIVTTYAGLQAKLRMSGGATPPVPRTKKGMDAEIM